MIFFIILFFVFFTERIMIVNDGGMLVSKNIEETLTCVGKNEKRKAHRKASS